MIRCCPHLDRKVSRGRWLLLLGYGNFFGAWCVCACDLHPDQKNINVAEGCYGWIYVRFVLCSWCVVGAVRTVTPKVKTSIVMHVCDPKLKKVMRSRVELILKVKKNGKVRVIAHPLD